MLRNASKKIVKTGCVVEYYGELTHDALASQSMASPNFALSRSAFSDVILADRAAAPAPERPQQVAATEGEVVLRLRVW